MLVWVEFEYLDANSKNGYLRRFAATTKIIIIKPNSAPARVDWTKWETPIAVEAKRNPGPDVLIKFEKFKS